MRLDEREPGEKRGVKTEIGWVRITGTCIFSASASGYERRLANASSRWALVVAVIKMRTECSAECPPFLDPGFDGI